MQQPKKPQNQKGFDVGIGHIWGENQGITGLTPVKVTFLGGNRL